MAGPCKEMAPETVPRSCKRFSGLTRIRFAPHERLHNRHRPRRGRVALAAFAGALLASGSVMPAHAVQVSGGGVCTGTMALTFSPALNRFPTTLSVGVSALNLGCTGVGGPFSLTSSALTGTAASCAGMTASGIGTVNYGTSNGTATIEMVGVGPAQVWVGVDLSDVIAAAGVFTWTNTTEIGNCLGPNGTTTMTLWGSFVAAA